MDYLETPILLLIFNRPSVTNEVFNRIRTVRPRKLFIAQDGPRLDSENDCDDIAKTREIIESGIDWDCEIHTLYRADNLGCKIAVSSAIDWFFENIDEGIILEDDCLADLTFFKFCEELLHKYRNDNRIMHISGNNFHSDMTVGQGSYYFSNINHCWGWATWARAWRHFDVDLSTFKEFRSEKRVKDIFLKRKYQVYFSDVMEDVLSGKTNSWAYIWNYCCLVQSGLTCRPNVNLVKNIGFSEDSTHTDNPNDPLSGIPIQPMLFPLQHPEIVLVSRAGDDLFLRRHRHYLITRWLVPVFKRIGLFRLARNIYYRILG